MERPPLERGPTDTSIEVIQENHELRPRIDTSLPLVAVDFEEEYEHPALRVDRRIGYILSNYNSTKYIHVSPAVRMHVNSL